MSFINIHLTATIGRNIDDVPMSDERWEAFQQAVHRVLDLACWRMTCPDGEMFNDKWSATTGAWGGVPEQNAHLLYTGTRRDGLEAADVAHHVETMTAALALLADEFQQDCIAVSYVVPGHTSGAGLVYAEVRS